jgi:hypothetical protein
MLSIPSNLVIPRCISKVFDFKLKYSDENNLIINTDIKVFVKGMSSRKQSISYYEKYRSVSPDKAKQDMFLGKKAEFFTALELWRDYGFPWLNPDLKIYPSGMKGWEADLPYHKKDPRFPDAHVKGCDHGTYDFCHDFSWTFQYSNNDGFYGHDAIFQNPGRHDLISFVFIDDPQSKEATIKSIVPWQSIKKYLKDPIKQSLIGQKKCIYYKDLRHNKEIING